MITFVITLIKNRWRRAPSKAIKRRMHTLTQNPAAYLRTVFLERKGKNPSYSTRAFARDIGMSQALLSLILNGKRPLTVKQAAQVAVLLELDSDDSQDLLEAALFSQAKGKNAQKLQERKGTKSANFKDYELERFKAIQQWWHIAILDLSTTKGFRDDPNWIARRLNISPIEARDAMERLLELGFLERTNGKVKKTSAKIYFATKNSELAVRNFHKQMLAKAQAELDKAAEKDFARRDISGITMAIRSDRVAEARRRIQAFQKDLAAYLTEGECDEVFQFNSQLFPLTNSLNSNPPKETK
jgi:uncharacterized protein (TIGR02147 family)